MVYNIPLYIYNGILAVEKNEILPFLTWMDLEYIMLGKISQKEKDKYHMILPFCGIKKKNRYKFTGSQIQRTNRWREENRRMSEIGEGD